MKEDLLQKALETLMPLEFYEATPEEFEEYRLAALAEVEGLCGDEEAIAAANDASYRYSPTLRIEPLDGGGVVHLAGPSTADDPWSLAVMALLDPSPTSARIG